MIKRITASILACLTVLASSACSLIIVNDMTDENNQTADISNKIENTHKTDSTVGFVKYTPSEDNAALSREFLNQLPVRDYNGATFFITTVNSDFISPDDTGNTVSRLAMIRNSKVEELLNLTLITTVTNGGNMLTEMKNALASDSYYSDLIMPEIYTVGSFRVEDTILNMRTLPFFDIDKPYFNKSSSDMTSGGYSTYGVAGHASISPSSFSAVLMNKKLLESSGTDVGKLYDSAESGAWTWDDYIALCESVRSLGNDERKYYTTASARCASRIPDLIFKASGRDFISAGIRRVPVVGYSPANTEKVMAVLKSIYTAGDSILDPTAGGVEIFSKGESAFLIDYLDIMPEITNSAADWGLLPLPKEVESGDYRTLIANTESVFAVPKNHTNGEYAAITLSYLNAASYGYIYDEYVNYSMLHVLRDNDSVKTLDLILDTAVFDFALAFGTAYPQIADATYKLVRSCASSGDLSAVYQTRKDAANDIMKKNFNLRH